MKTSTLAVFAATLALTAPAYAQDTSVSVGVSTEVSAETPSVDTSVSAEANADATASAEDGGAANFDIDANLDLDITVDQTVEIRKIVVESNVQPVAVDFDVSIGTTIPASVTLAPLPAGIVALNAGLEGYLFFMLADGRIVVVSPTTLQVVLIIRA